MLPFSKLTRPWSTYPVLEAPKSETPVKGSPAPGTTEAPAEPTPECRKTTQPVDAPRPALVAPKTNTASASPPSPVLTADEHHILGALQLFV